MPMKASAFLDYRSKILRLLRRIQSWDGGYASRASSGAKSATAPRKAALSV